MTLTDNQLRILGHIANGMYRPTMNDRTVSSLLGKGLIYYSGGGNFYDVTPKGVEYLKKRGFYATP